TGYMYCEGGEKLGLTLYAYSLSDPARTKLLIAIPAVSDAQIARWYEEGEGIPQDIWGNFYCARDPQETLIMPASYLTAGTLTAPTSQVAGAPIRAYNSTNSPEGRLFRLRISGSWETADYIYDAFWRREKSTGNLTTS